MYRVYHALPHPPLLLLTTTSPMPVRWLDGAFLELDAENIEAEVDDYYRELYKIQKLFNLKMKKMTVEREERERERQKRNKHLASSSEDPKVCIRIRYSFLYI